MDMDCGFGFDDDDDSLLPPHYDTGTKLLSQMEHKKWDARQAWRRLKGFDGCG
jgi:hypothetical protein